MGNLENVSAEDLRQILAEVDDADATEQLMTGSPAVEKTDVSVVNRRYTY